MATTTQILFNDPALHSLKRDQLVKLCKIHSIKANGKNTELIERLKQYAHGLPGNVLTDLDDAMEGVEEEQTLELPGGMPVDEDEGEDQITTQTNYFPATANVNDNIEEYDMQDIVLTSRSAMPRPSEQWEVVMDDIEEVDEVTIGTASSKNSLRTVSNGEFGTHSSKTTVSSSIKALATSLGIKRTHSKSSRQTQDIEEDTNPKMPSFSPGKLFSSTKARDSLAAHATPYSEIPHSESLPDTDVFKFSTPDASILGLNDDHDDDSNGETNLNAEAQSLLKPTLRVAGGVKSTIRLVSQPAASRSNQEYAYMSPPRLPVVKTDFDLTMGTPGTLRSLNIWPASSFTAGKDAGQRLYPALPVEDLKADLEHKQETAVPGGIGMPTATPEKTPAKSDRFSVPSATKDTNAHAPVDEPDMFSPFKPSTAASGAVATSTPGRSAPPHPPIPRSTPFLFGSPLPRHEPRSVIRSIDRNKHKDQEEGATVGVSNAAFDGVAKSVLEEMQRRVAEVNAQNAKSGDGGTRPLPAPPLFGPSLTFAVPTGAGIAQDRFAKLHQAEFSKMDSIATHYAARRPNKRKSDALGNGRPMAGQKRRSSAAGARVISAGSRKRMAVPGGFGGDDDSGGEEDEGVRGEADDDEDAGARRSSKRMRITQGWDVHRGQRVSLAPPLAPAEEEKKQKEREAVKRDLDAAKARRRSSRGRPSMGAPPARGKASRFGFLASAKSIVRNVWNIGGGSKAKPSTAPSSIPVPKPSQAPPPTAPDIAKKKAKTMTDTAPKQPPYVAGNARQASRSQPRGSSQSSTSSKLLKPSSSATDGKATVTTGSRSRSPIPPFTAQTASVKSTSTATSRPSSIMGTTRSWVSASNTVPTSGTAASRQTSRTSTVSSMGTRTSIASGSSAAVSSIGTRRSLVSTSNTASASSKNDKNLPDGKNQPILRKRTSSLLAPTASSLAKINATVKLSLTGRASGLSPVTETQLQSKRASITTQARSARASIMSTNSSPLSPRPTRIFSQPLTNFVSPASSSSGTHNHPSLTAAATSIMTSAEADAASSPSKIPRPAVLPPKPKQLIARKPRISRSRVIAKLGAQRAAAAQGGSVPGSPGARTRSSMGAVGRRSLGGVKSGGRASAGADAMRVAVKKRARQSEYTRRKSRTTSENERREVDE